MGAFTSLFDKTRAGLGLPVEQPQPAAVPPLPEAGGVGTAGGGSPFGGQTTPGAAGETERRTEIERRGFAPPTAEAIATAASNALSLVRDPVTTGLAAIGELGFGQTPGAFGGISNIPGHFKLAPDLAKAYIGGRMSITAARREQEKRNARNVARAAAASGAFSFSDVGATRRAAGQPGGMGGNAGGGFGTGPRGVHGNPLGAGGSNLNGGAV